MGAATKVFGCVLLTAIAAGPALAAERAAPAQPADASPPTQAQIRQAGMLQAVLDTPSVLGSHPDLWYRSVGTAAYQDGHKADALRAFLWASRFADKPSQAMVAIMYWNGEGVAADHARAYAWMDLAADRGYRTLLLQRERYWSLLSEAERVRAVEIGRVMHAEYSDQRGIKRLGYQLSSAYVHLTGSHLGWSGNGFSLSGMDPMTRLGGTFTDLSQLGDANLWKADRYVRLKDLQWNLLQGQVDVGLLETVDKPAGDSPSP